MTWNSLDKTSLTCTTWELLTVLPGTSHLKTRHVASQLQSLTWHKKSITLLCKDFSPTVECCDSPGEVVTIHILVSRSGAEWATSSVLPR